MPIRQPIEYELNPDTVEPGTRWVTLRLTNRGSVDLRHLAVQLNALDTYSVDVHGTGHYLDVLRVDEEKQIPFQVDVKARGRVYVTLDGHRDGEKLHWESPGLQIRVQGEIAELVSFFAMTEPYPLQGDALTCELKIRALGVSRNLVVEFWVETPRGEFRSLDKRGTEVLEPGTVSEETVTFTPDEEGIYIIHAYLFDGARRIDHLTDSVSVSH
jgi:hypothetical protein